MAIEGIQDISFADISGGYGGGRPSASNIMEYLFDTLQTAGYEGFENYDWMGQGSLGTTGEYWGSEIPYYPGQEDHGFTLSDWRSYLDPEESYGGSTVGYGGWEEGTAETDISSRLLSALESLKIPTAMRDYRGASGEVGAGIGSELGVLRKTLLPSSKSSRFSSLGAGGGFRGRKEKSKYLADYYGLMQKQDEMMSGLRSGVEGDFRKNLIDYMGLHPSAFTGS